MSIVGDCRTGPCYNSANLLHLIFSWLSLVFNGWVRTHKWVAARSPPPWKHMVKDKELGHQMHSCIKSGCFSLKRLRVPGLDIELIRIPSWRFWSSYIQDLPQQPEVLHCHSLLLDKGQVDHNTSMCLLHLHVTCCLTLAMTSLVWKMSDAPKAST